MRITQCVTCIKVSKLYKILLLLVFCILLNVLIILIIKISPSLIHSEISLFANIVKLIYATVIMIYIQRCVRITF